MLAATVMQLIRKLHSEDSKVVLQAVEELRAHGWLSDGSLIGARLRHVHLHGADLYRVNLQGADLYMANLQNADLSMANFRDADLSMANLKRADLSKADFQGADLYKVNLWGARNLTDDQLAQASRLWGATLPDGSPYDGRFNLSGDAEFVRLQSTT
jgi:uncharacterized protein YjbI with pentapeptide repeats